MKTTSKHLIATTAIGIVLVFTATSPALAVTETDNNSQNICARLLTLRKASLDKSSKKISTMETSFSNRLSKMESNQSTVDQNVANAREDRKARFEAKIKEMESESGLSETQIAAIETFKTDMESAEATREKAVDTARATFRAALKTAITNRQEEAIAAANAYHEALEAAFTDASLNCSTTSSLSALKSSIRTARENMIETRNGSQLGQTIRQLAKTRNEAVKAANDAFKATAKQYAQTLADALKS